MTENNTTIDSSVRKLLWTGGWDSTFRLLQLVVEKGETILPVYIIDTERASTMTEIKTMDKIRDKIVELFPETAGRILPTVFFSIHDIAPAPEITDKFNNLKKQAHIGQQYEWLARYAKQHNINDLELSIHVDDHAYKFIRNFVEKDTTHQQDFYSLAAGTPDTNPLSLFKVFRFPLLEWSKVKMKEQALKTGTFDIMNMTWFCHKPIDGQPCGLCNPCKYSIEEGMEFRFPQAALMRHKMALVYKFANKLRRLVNNTVHRPALAVR